MNILTSIKLYDANIENFLRSPSGPVAEQILKRGEAVAVLARQNVQDHSRTGALLDSISVDPVPSPEGLAASVGSDLPQGGFLEFGTHPHTIEPRDPDGELWSRADNPDPLLFPPQRSVDHPGNQPYPWLEPALESVFH